MTRRPARRREPWLLGVARALAAVVGWFLFVGLFTVVLMLLGVKR